jgi:hypothetical protein
MVKLGTFCEECCFYDKNNQNCKHGLLEVFKERHAEIIWEDSFPKIDRVCQYKRSIDWENDKTDDEKIKICTDEVYISGTIVLITNNKEHLLEAIIKLKQCKNIERFMFIIIYKNIAYKDMLDICGNNISSKYKCVKITDENIELQIYRSLKFANNGYLFILDSEKPFDENLIDKVDNFVNKKMFRLLHIPGSSKLHESVSMIHLYKWLKGDLETNFANKLNDISQEENSNNQISTWKDINEHYSS